VDDERVNAHGAGVRGDSLTTKGGRSTRPPFAISLETPRRSRAWRAAGGTSPGTDEAGVSVWIPLAFQRSGSADPVPA